MSTTKRAAARSKGLRLAARVAAVGGMAVAALGLVEARAASAPHVASALRADLAAGDGSGTSDDARPLPMEGWAKAAAGGCGCSPCWGPPAPPSKGTARRARARARTGRTKRATNAKRPSRGAR